VGGQSPKTREAREMTASAARKVTVLEVLGNGGIFSKHLTGYEERPQQLQTAQLIEQGIRERKHVVVELGTGGGKSHSALVPSVLSCERVVYSTEFKSLQEQIALKDAPFVASMLEDSMGRPIRYAVLKGRGNYVCMRNVSELEERGEFRSVPAAEAFRPLLEWIGEQREAGDVADIESYPDQLPVDLRQDVVTSTEECTGQRCKLYRECFAERARARARRANIIIVNHKLLCVDAMIREKTGAQAAMIPDYSVLIADEAHGWEDVLRDTAGFEITPGRMRRLAWMLQKATINHEATQNPERAEYKVAQGWAYRQDDVFNKVEQFLAQLKDRLTQNEDVREIRLGDERGVLVGDEPLPGMEDARPTIGAVAADLAKFSWEIAGGTPSWLDDEGRDSWAKLAEQTEQLATDLATVLAPEQDATWVRRAKLDGENGKTRVVLDAKPVDVAPIASRWFFNTTKQKATKKDADGIEEEVESLPPLVVVSMSATIATNGTMTMFRSRMGVGDAHELVNGSPFDYEHHSLLYLPSNPQEMTPVQKRDPNYDRYVSNLCAEMRGLTLDAKGGAFLLFTSRSMMNTVFERIAPDLQAAGLLVMKQGDASRNQMIAEFREDGNAVLFGLKTFGVGIDVQGNALRLVAIDKVPFNPPTDVVWKALCDDVKRKGGNDFRDLSMPNAILTLKQFAGRLIRSKADRGVMALLDGRISVKPYGREILRNMPPAPITSDPSRVRALYGEMQYAPVQAPTPKPHTAPVVVTESPRRFRRLSDAPQSGRFRRLSRV
jgi:ATP-dependent DNA helicase DinG